MTLRGRPRSLRLDSGRTRLVRRGDGLRLSLPRRAVLLVTVERLGRRGRPIRAARLKAGAGRHVLRLGVRLPGGRRLRPGRARIRVTAIGRDGGRGPAVRTTVRLRA